MAEQKLSADCQRLLYDRHGAALVVFACAFLPDVAAAEYAVHQVFLRLLHGETQTPDIPLAYLYRAVRNTPLNARRNDHREASLESQDVLFEHRNGNGEIGLALEAALRELPDEQREVVVMRVRSGMTLEEVAAATNTPLNTIASRSRYALEKLRQRLQTNQRPETEKE